MKRVLLLATIFLAISASAQQYNLHGSVADTTAAPVVNATISLLEPGDSTLAYFGISNSSGQFEIRSVNAGRYLLQIASLGYRVCYKPLEIPGSDNELGYFILHRTAQLLNEVEVISSKIPMMLKGDTVEYNAGAFKVKQDAVVEDLLRKMPGIQLDKSGNIKAQGKDVKKVLVDGKEFFGNDPKMATKNLPADAIDKVQVFGNKSDATLFTGIDDGEREQTINLQLKDSKRKGYFGDEEAGAGTDGHYKLSGKLYRFQPKRQLSVLGMLNDINQFGFTFQDYLSFQGGLRGLTDGAGPMGTQTRNNVPVNFGQPVSGLITSGGAGINYSTSTGTGNRFTISYLGNGASKDLSEQSISRNFITNNLFTTAEDQQQKSANIAHRLSFSWRNNIDSAQQLVLRGGATLTGNTTTSALLSVSDMDDTVRNRLTSYIQDHGSGLNASFSASYLKKFRQDAWPVWKLTASGNIETSATGTEWNNTSFYLNDTALITDHQYQDNDSRHTTWEAGTSIVRRLPFGLLEPSLKAGADADGIVRRQGLLPAGKETDSLSPDFSRTWNWLRPGISFRHNTAKTQLSIGLDAESGQLGSDIRREHIHTAGYNYLKPSVFYQNAYAQGRQLNLAYMTSVAPPASLQMLPATNYLNPLQRLAGNPLLAPEYRHTLQANWMRFDQFSSTSLMLHLHGMYTRNKISIARYILPDLSEDDRYINVPDDYVISAGGSYNTPIRRLGLKLSIDLEERYNQGLSVVNDATNKNSTFNHNLKLSVANAQRKYWDIVCGLEADITEAQASLNSAGDARFYHYNGYAQISYNPSASFHISLTANMDQYNAPSFPDAVTVPLINAAASYYFLNYRRGVLTLDAFDLLNRNTSVQRISQLNYLLERRSNIIQQYFLLSFKYRLSKAGNGKRVVDVQLKR